MNVLVINCGSSSLKYQLIDSETENVLAKGLCERIGMFLCRATVKSEKQSDKYLAYHDRIVIFLKRNA